MTLFSVPLGEWIPDQPDLENGTTEAKNCVPAAKGYVPLKTLTDYSLAADGTILEITAAKSAGGVVSLFAGDTTKLYKHNTATNALDNVSKSGNYSLATNDRWQFIQFGTKEIAVSGHTVNTQNFTLGTSSLFSDLAGAPRSKYIGVVRDFVVMGNIYESSTAHATRVRWSAIDDETGWTVGTNQSDFQNIPDAGHIQGIVGGENGTIFLERGIARMSYVGSPLIFQFDMTETGRGCAIPGSICNIGALSFYFSDDGFYAYSNTSGESQPIGAEKINRTMLADIDRSYDSKMTSAIDPLNQIAVWSYVSNDASGSTPDKLLIYNYAINRWSRAEVDCDMIAPFFDAGYTLEGMDTINASIDAHTISFDSDSLKGGTYFFGGSASNKVSTFNGAAMAATIETGEFAANKGKFSLVTQVQPNTEGGTVTAQISGRSRQQDAASFDSAQSLNAAGFCPVRNNSRFHKVRLNLSGAWTQAQSVEVEASAAGSR